MKDKLYAEEGFNLYAEIYAAAAAHGVNLDEMDAELRHDLESSVARLSRRFICLIVDEELARLKRGNSSI